VKFFTVVSATHAKKHFLSFFSPRNLTKNTANVVLLQFTAAHEQILVLFFCYDGPPGVYTYLQNSFTKILSKN